jgi:hypothetical protein
MSVLYVNEAVDSETNRGRMIEEENRSEGRVEIEPSVLLFSLLTALPTGQKKKSRLVQPRKTTAGDLYKYLGISQTQTSIESL